MENKIDFVMIWVDGSDPKWLESKNKYSPEKIDVTNSIERFRDWDNLKYWFRGVEKFAPWVNKIHFVTCGHVPSWLNLDNPKLNFVKHEDYMPDEFLPTFSANPIELNLHRIEGLAEQFVFFNDDMFLLKNVKPEDFFIDGLPCDEAIEDILVLGDSDGNFEHILVNDLEYINRHFDKKKFIKNNFSKRYNFKYGKDNIKNILLSQWSNIAGFKNGHTAASFLKSVYGEVWDKEYELLYQTSMNKFRTNKDVNQYLIKLWQIYSGRFVPKSNKRFSKYFSVKEDNSELLNWIVNQDSKLVCINDTDPNLDFERCKKEINGAFEMILSEKSTFEK